MIIRAVYHRRLFVVSLHEFDEAVDWFPKNSDNGQVGVEVHRRATGIGGVSHFVLVRVLLRAVLQTLTGNRRAELLLDNRASCSDLDVVKIRLGMTMSCHDHRASGQ